MTCLRRTKDTEGTVHIEIKKRLESFTRVDDIRISPHSFNFIHLDNRLKKKYQFVLKIAEMIILNLMPVEETGNYSFIDFTKDEDKMRTLFEKFIRNFFKAKLHHEAKVKSENLEWDFKTTGQTTFLPQMKTDTTIHFNDRVLIIETKFTPKLFEGHYLSTRSKLNSKHLYQLSSYLNNYQTSKPLSGMLLYPTTSKDVSMAFESANHSLQVQTIDLSKDWEQIEEKLLRLVAA